MRVQEGMEKNNEGKRKGKTIDGRRRQQTETGLSLCVCLMWMGRECRLTHRHSNSSAGLTLKQHGHFQSPLLLSGD